jgi:hypothetical protein
MSPSRASLEQSSPLGNDPRLDLRAAPEHVERHCKTIGEGGLGSEAEPLGGALRIADRDPHLAATRGTAMHDEFCSAQLCHGLRKAPHTRCFAGTDIEDECTGGRRPHRAAQRADCIAYISEIAGLLTISVNLDRFAAK